MSSDSSDAPRTEGFGFHEQLLMYDDTFDEALFDAVCSWACDKDVSAFRVAVDAAIARLRSALATSLDDAVACVGENVTTDRGIVVNVVLYRRRPATP